jgi:hypothetical protein
LKSLLNDPLSAEDSVAKLHSAGKQPIEASLAMVNSQCFGAVTPSAADDIATLP